MVPTALSCGEWYILEGKVFVQSFTPFSPSIHFACRHDFGGYFQQEMGSLVPRLYLYHFPELTHHKDWSFAEQIGEKFMVGQLR